VRNQYESLVQFSSRENNMNPPRLHVFTHSHIHVNSHTYVNRYLSLRLVVVVVVGPIGWVVSDRGCCVLDEEERDHCKIHTCV